MSSFTLRNGVWGVVLSFFCGGGREQRMVYIYREGGKEMCVHEEERERRRRKRREEEEEEGGGGGGRGGRRRRRKRRDRRERRGCTCFFTAGKVEGVCNLAGLAAAARKIVSSIPNCTTQCIALHTNSQNEISPSNRQYTRPHLLVLLHCHWSLVWPCPSEPSPRPLMTHCYCHWNSRLLLVKLSLCPSLSQQQVLPSPWHQWSAVRR